MRAVFLGTPEFAVPTLERMLAAGHAVSLVVTQPDRPKGRKQELTPSPVKAAALRAWHSGVPAGAYPASRSARAPARRSARSDGGGRVRADYSQAVIDLAPLGIVNVHASLLPELRGAAPIQWSIARGYERTGVTTMRIDAGLDTGDILLRWETPIGEDETAPELSARLAKAGADLLVETLAAPFPA